MEFDNFSSANNERFNELEASHTWSLLMRKVYTWMAMALTITGAVAYGVSNSEAMLTMLYSGMGPILICSLAELGIVIYLSSRIEKLSLTTATMWFIIFAILNGVTLSAIFLIYTLTSIAQTFFVTAGTFAAMAIVGSTTKKDLTQIGGILFMALIGLIIAVIVNAFLHSPMFNLIVSGIGVLIFTGLTAWDAQKIKEMVKQAPDANESAQKIALLGSLRLYLDFINLFFYLLRFLGRRN